ncbi:arginine deiminase-related protein [Pseudomonas putida]|uniref:arginine deiminase-related protein n=1 Tax=Pseudomonas putida TaxID=303 RepID=UPI003D32BA37
MVSKARALEVRMRLKESGRDVIDLTNQQIGEFTGNAIELSGRHGRAWPSLAGRSTA